MMMMAYQWPQVLHQKGKGNTACLGAARLESEEPSFVKKLIYSIYLDASKVG